MRPCQKRLTPPPPPTQQRITQTSMVLRFLRTASRAGALLDSRAKKRFKSVPKSIAFEHNGPINRLGGFASHWEPLPISQLHHLARNPETWLEPWLLGNLLALDLPAQGDRTVAGAGHENLDSARGANAVQEPGPEFGAGFEGGVRFCVAFGGWGGGSVDLGPGRRLGSNFGVFGLVPEGGEGYSLTLTQTFSSSFLNPASDELAGSSNPPSFCPKLLNPSPRGQG